MFTWLSDPNVWVSLFTLTILEIVLGVDNIIFISILAGKLPAEQQGRARSIGLLLALVTRILLLSSIFLLTKLTRDLFAVFGHGFSGKDLVMLIGGLFLVWKSIKEIHHAMEGVDHELSTTVKPKFAAVIGTIVLVDILFSLDSVITAVGLVGGSPSAAHEPAAILAARGAVATAMQSAAQIPAAALAALTDAQAVLAAPVAPEMHGSPIVIMITAIILSMLVMLAAAKSIGDFVNRHPTVKLLALSFLILVGFVLIADGFGHHVPKGYIYFAMAFSFIVEVLNIRTRGKKKTPEPVDLRSEY